MPPAQRQAILEHRDGHLLERFDDGEWCQRARILPCQLVATNRVGRRSQPVLVVARPLERSGIDAWLGSFQLRASAAYHKRSARDCHWPATGLSLIHI